MTRAPGKSCLRGLLLAAFAFFSTACNTVRLTETGQPLPPNMSTQQVKLLVQENGLFAVTQQDLAHFGLEIGDMSSAEMRLTQGGKIVPTFTKDDSLIFYGQAPQSRYTDVRPYILEKGQQGTEIRETAVTNLTAPPITEVPQTLHLEENHVYTAEARQDDHDDVWFWSELGQQETFDTEVEILNLSASPALMRINSWGFTYDAKIEGDHDFDLRLNDILIGTVVWDGQTYNSSATTIPASTLVQGTNTITLDNRGEGASFLDIMQVNWLELDYTAPAQAVNDRLTFSNVDGLVQMSSFSDEPLIINISDAANPELLVDWKFDDQQVFLPVNKEMVVTVAGPDGFQTPTIEAVRDSDWRNPDQQADLIIVTTDELGPSLAPLVQVREAQGLSVVLVPVADIYDEFGYGETTPESIRQFITYAYENWQEPHPRYLFLVGDATTDYLGHITELPLNLVPSLLVPVQYSGETVSDSRLTDVDGDKRPDLAVGRWPVRTVQEVENLVKRTLAYEQGLASNRVIFAFDNSEARFSSIVENLAKISQIPTDQLQQIDGLQTQDIAEQWNEGAWLATYVGHGSIARWSKEDIFNQETMRRLKSETPPIVLQLTCLTGLFSHPVETSLTEAMLTHPEGPVLTVAATSLTLSDHQEPFAVQLLQQMQDSNIIRIGDAFQEAKLSLEIDNANGLREVSDTFALFGDPSTTMVRP